MKAVVVEIQDKYASLLQDDGTFIKKRNDNYSIGETVNIYSETYKKPTGLRSIVAAAAMLMILVCGGAYAYSVPIYQVSLEVNPSITVGVNMFDRVTGIENINEDAEQILADTDIVNQDIEDTVAEITNCISEAGYFKVNEDLLIAVSGKNEAKANQLAFNLCNSAQEALRANGEDVTITAEGIGYDMVQEAKTWGLNPGRYNIITKHLGIVIESQEEADYFSDVPIKDLMAIYTSTKGQMDKENNDQGNNDNQKANKNDEIGNNTDSNAGNNGKSNNNTGKNGEEDNDTPGEPPV